MTLWYYNQDAIPTFLFERRLPISCSIQKRAKSAAVKDDPFKTNTFSKQSKTLNIRTNGDSTSGGPPVCGNVLKCQNSVENCNLLATFSSFISLGKINIMQFLDRI